MNSLAIMFVLIGVTLICSLGLSSFLLRRRDGMTPDSALAGWYRMRREDLEAAATIGELDEVAVEQLEKELQLSLVEGVTPSGEQLQTAAVSLSALLGLAGLMLVLALTLYNALGGYQDVLLSNALDQVAPEDQAIENLIEQVEKRTLQRPENIHYWNILGRYYTSVSRYEDASAAFEQLLSLTPEDASVLAQAAQAEYLAAGRTLSPRAQELALQALNTDPAQSTALGLLGMAFFEAGEYVYAIEFWQRLLRTSAASGESGEIIQRAIERAQGMLATSAEQPAIAGPSITVSLALATTINVDPASTVFVFARAREFPMPVAAQRLTAADLPITITLSDAQAMTPQVRLSLVEEVEIVARISPTGAPGEEAASHQISSGWIKPASQSASEVHLVLQSEDKVSKG